MYIYIYICVCVCVCMSYPFTYSELTISHVFAARIDKTWSLASVWFFCKMVSSCIDFAKFPQKYL